MMDNQCANIFSTHATVYGSHSAMFAFFWKREYFFFMCILNLVSFFFKKKTWFVSFYLSPPPLFFPKTVFPKTCYVFPIFIGGVVSISYRVELFVFPWFSIFSYPFLDMFTLYWVVFVNTWQKGGNLDEMWESCLFCLEGNILIVYDIGKYKYVLMYLT